MQIENNQGFEGKFKKIFFISLGVFLVACFCFFAFKVGSVIDVINVKETTHSFWQKISTIIPVSDYKKDPERIDLLLLGIRGENDPNGGLLSDTIMLISYKKDTGQLALFSIPRDLYIDIPGISKKERINYAYAYGESKEYGGGGLKLSKRIVSNIIGLNIDYAVSVDFKAFQEIVDILGGVTVYRDKPFIEDMQWQGEGIETSPFWYKKSITDELTGETKEIWALHVPAGKSVLDGSAALYYVRSRFTTSDFDRAKRQQEILLSLKEKGLSLGVLANPFKVLKIMDSLKRNLKTDIPAEKMLTLIDFARGADVSSVKKIGLDTSLEGLLYETKTEEGAYILLPVGDNFDKIKETFRNIFIK